MASTINASTSSGLVNTADTSGVLQLQTANTTAVTIDASQNVGIGTSSPTDNLYISRSTNAAGGISVVNTNNAQASQIAQLYLQGGDNAYAQIKLQANSVNSSIRGNSDGSLAFLSSTTERMRINSAGNVGIGTTSPNAKLEVLSASGGTIRLSETASKYVEINGYGEGSANGSVMAFNTITAGTSTLTERGRFGNNGTLFIGGTTSPVGTQRLVLTANGGAGVEPMLFNELRTGSSTENYVLFYRNGSQVGSIQNNATNTIYNTSSDYRLKEDIAPMTGALAKVALLKPVTYKWKVNGSDGQGFIAHELQEVVPDCVSGEKDAVRTVNELDENGNVISTKEVPDYQGIDTSFLVATLTAAIQELNAKVDAQALEIQALKGVA